MKYFFALFVFTSSFFSPLSSEVKLYTYNVLSDDFIENNNYREYCDSEVLKWESRKFLLVDKFIRLDADILCLQEVNRDTYLFFLDELSKQGYRGGFIEDRGKFRNGVATFYRHSVVSCLSMKPIYCEGSSNCGKKAVRAALISIFSVSDGNIIGIVNTKLKWMPEETSLADHPGYRQIKFILKDVVQFSKDQHWVILGDFNITPFHPIVTDVLKKKGFYDPYEGDAMLTFYNSDETKRIDYLFCSDNLKTNKLLGKSADEVAPIPSSQEPSDHLPVGINILL